MSKFLSIVVWHINELHRLLWFHFSWGSTVRLIRLQWHEVHRVFECFYRLIIYAYSADKQWQILGGVRDTCPLSVHLFIFYAVLGEKNDQNNTLMSHLWGLFPSEKSWIRHWEVFIMHPLLMIWIFCSNYNVMLDEWFY